MRFPVAPMKAAIGQLPHDDEQWAYEIKWDGYRTIVFVDVAAHTVRVQSSSGLDVTRTYGELGGMWRDLNATSAVLDGEIVVFIVFFVGNPKIIFCLFYRTMVYKT